MNCAFSSITRSVSDIPLDHRTVILDPDITVIDLHTHTTASDGTVSPAELVAEAAVKGIRVLAITDHDTLDGVPEAVSAGLRHNVRVVPGIEIDVEFSPGVFHVLGLGMYKVTPEVHRCILELQELRTERNLAILGRMQKQGIQVSYQQMRDETGAPVLGRPHFARFLVQRGIATSMQDAYARFLGPDGVLHVERKKLSLRRATGLIHNAGGKAVLAHPHTLFVSRKMLSQSIPAWKESGLDGIEAFHPHATGGDLRFLIHLAEDTDLLISGGSDYHGPERADRKLGRAVGGKKIPAVYAEPFLPENIGIAGFAGIP
jgi:3',5'-nucleoside bisphosphate phosphatase